MKEWYFRTSGMCTENGNAERTSCAGFTGVSRRHAEQSTRIVPMDGCRRSEENSAILPSGSRSGGTADRATLGCRLLGPGNPSRGEEEETLAVLRDPKVRSSEHRRLTQADLLRAGEAILRALVVAARNAARQDGATNAAVRSRFDSAAIRPQRRVAAIG